MKSKTRKSEEASPEVLARREYQREWRAKKKAAALAVAVQHDGGDNIPLDAIPDEQPKRSSKRSAKRQSASPLSSAERVALARELIAAVVLIVTGGAK